MIHLSNSSSPVTHADIDDVEQRFGFQFPRELRELYLQCNGGHPDEDRFVDQSGASIVHQFLPIRYPKPPLGTLETSIQRTRIEKSLLPAHLVPFAIDPGGNYYCFSSRTADLGSICLFYMDQADRPESAIEYLTGSFREFLSKLTHRR